MAGYDDDDDGASSVSSSLSSVDGNLTGNFRSAEEAEEAVRNIGQAPMLDSVQQMLRKQQQKEVREKELALKDLQEDLRRAQKERESLGVRLYGMQQQLATLQIKLEESHVSHQTTAQARSEAEATAKEQKQVLEDFQREAKKAEEKLKNAQAEENAVKAAVKQVQAFLEETKGEIAVMRRATHKTEEAVGELEKKKTDQDLYIDSRVERVAQLQDEIALIEAQKQSQGAETAAAEETLREASREMNATVLEKRQVMGQWNSTLVALQRRDEAFQAMVDATHEKQEANRALLAEIRGYKTSAQKVQYESERLMERKLRQEQVLKQTDDSLNQCERAYAKLSGRFALYKKSLEQQDAEARKLKGMLGGVTNELNSLRSQTEIVDRNRRALEVETAALLNDRLTATKATKNLAREASKVQKQVHAAELEVANVENEMARVRIDKLTTQAHTEKLNEDLQARLAELQEKDKLIEKYKAEIRQRNDQIEKRTYVVDRLNRKLEKLSASKEEPESLGPLEATIKNLGRETTALKQQNRELERQWLRLQTEFVKVVSEMENETAVVHELSSTETILLQKRKRLDNKIASQESELKQLEAQVRRMHNDMHKLNELIAEHKGKHEELADANEVMQADFVAELKELESKSVQAEATIERTKLEKQALLDEIMESERQIKLWEKKIQLEKETQQALDPTVGQSEVKAMEKEIHRMRIRYDNLIREQERMIKEMETAILKRETIANRKRGAKNKKHGPAAPRRGSDEAIAAMTQSELLRKLKLERKEIKRYSKECAAYELQIAEKLQESENTSMELEKASNIFASVEDSIVAEKKNINAALYQKQKNIETLSRMQAMVAKYVDFARCPVTQSPVAQEEADIMLEQSYDQVQTIVQTLKKVSAAHPHLEEVLDRVASLLE